MQQSDEVEGTRAATLTFLNRTWVGEVTQDYPRDVLERAVAAAAMQDLLRQKELSTVTAPAPRSPRTPVHSARAAAATTSLCTARAGLALYERGGDGGEQAVERVQQC